MTADMQNEEDISAISATFWSYLNDITLEVKTQVQSIFQRQTYILALQRSQQCRVFLTDMCKMMMGR